MTDTIAFDLKSIELLQDLAGDQAQETCAVGLVAPAGVRDGRLRYVVRDFQPVPESAYLSRDSVSAVLSPEFCLSLANLGRKEGMGIIIAHTHVGASPLQEFSAMDDMGEISLQAYYNSRVPNQVHFSAIFTSNSGRCRKLGTNQQLDIQAIGREVKWLPATSVQIPNPHPRFMRQVLAFGPEVQNKLSSLRVAIVGLGGTGSVVANELAHLGVLNFILIDPDVVEESNLNRLLGATRNDCGKTKVEVFSEYIRRLAPDSTCLSICGNIVDEKVARNLLSVDFIFMCTDSHASRAVINQLAYQYLIPAIDMGVAIHSSNGEVLHIAGRSQMIASGLGCLVCAGWLDFTRIRFEMMNDEQRKKDAYFPGETVPQPAVISLNAAVASMAVTTFLAAMTALPSEARLINYDAINGSMRPALLPQDPMCVVCSSSGSLARGDTWSLPTRSDDNQ